MITWEFREHLRNKAMHRVKKAIALGKLPKLDGSVPCQDCGAPARCYDHRDYRAPLQVTPVRVSCNGQRGAALPIANKAVIEHGKYWDTLGGGEGIDGLPECPLHAKVDFEHLEFLQEEFKTLNPRDRDVAVAFRELNRYPKRYTT